MQFAIDFNFSQQNIILLLVLYIFGACWVLMAGLVYLPRLWLAILSIAIIVLHNLLDPIKAGQLGDASWVWNVLHQPGFFMAMRRGVVIVYPLLRGRWADMLGNLLVAVVLSDAWCVAPHVLHADGPGFAQQLLWRLR